MVRRNAARTHKHVSLQNDNFRNCPVSIYVSFNVQWDVKLLIACDLCIRSGLELSFIYGFERDIFI